MRWRRLIYGKASWARIAVETQLSELGGGLALVDDLVATTEAVVAIMKMEGSLRSCG